MSIGAKTEDKDGMLPVHYAMGNKGPSSADFVDALLTAFPEAVEHGNLKVSNTNQTINYAQSNMLNRVIETARIDHTLQTME